MNLPSSRARRLIVLVVVLLVGVAAFLLYDQWQTRRFYEFRLESSAELQKIFGEPTNPSVAAVLDPSKPIRLAIGPLGLPAPANGQLADLLTVELSRAERFALVERRELDRALTEMELSFGGLVRAAAAVKVGRIVRADWFLLGSPGHVETATNAILARIVDARSSILRDVAIFPARHDPALLSREVAAFLQRAARVTTNETPRTYLAIGGFEDLSVNNRYAGFPQQLRTYLTTSYQGSTTTLVERELVNALLQEVRLDLAGLTAEGATHAPVRMQSAFWLVDGFYQSYEQSGPEIDLVLRVERVLGGRELVSLRGQPEEALFRRAREAVDSTLAKGEDWVRWPGRRSEISAQLNRGIERSRLDEGSLAFPLNGWGGQVAGHRLEEEPEKLQQNLEEATRCFEAVLLLDPDHREAKTYLATCLTHPLLHRLEEGRNYYREVIASPKQDAWSRRARMALGRSYWWSEPRRAFELFRDFAAQAKDTNEAAALRQHMQSLLRRGEVGEEERVTVAEQEVRAALDQAARGRTNSPDHPQFSLGALADSFPNRTNGVAFLNRVLPRLLEDYPTLKPHLLAEAVAFQLETNSAVVRQFRESLEWCAQHTSEVSYPRSYFDTDLTRPYYWAGDRGCHDLVIRLTEVRQAAADRGLASEVNDEHRMRLAFAYAGQERWAEALRVFESMGNRSVWMGGKGPWGHWHHPHSAPAGAQWCRLKLGLPRAPDDIHTELSDPFFTNTLPFAFDSDEQVLWLAGGRGLTQFDAATKERRRVPLPKDEEVEVTAVYAGADQIWVGTAGAGVFEVDRKSDAVIHLTTEDGLLLDEISCFLLQDSVLWIGYGRGRAGGVGQLDLRTRRVRSLTPALSRQAVGVPQGTQGPLALETPDGPPRHRVAGIARGADSELWLAVPGKGVQRYRTTTDSWETFSPARDENEVACVLVDAKRVIAGRLQRHFADDRRAMVPLSLCRPGWKDCTPFSLRDGLPYVDVTALALRGSELWVGGPAYIAVIDLTQLQVTRTFSFCGEGVNQIKIAGDSAWVRVDRQLFRIPLDGSSVEQTATDKAKAERLDPKTDP